MVVSQSGVMFILVAAGRRRVDGQATLKAVLVVGAKNNLANQTFMSYDMTLIDYMKDRIPKNVLWKLPSTLTPPIFKVCA